MLSKLLVLLLLLLFILYHFHPSVHCTVDQVSQELRCWINERHVRANDWESFEEEQPISAVQAQWKYEWDYEDPVVDQFRSYQTNDTLAPPTTPGDTRTGLDPLRPLAAMYVHDKRIFPQKTLATPIQRRRVPFVTEDDILAIRSGW
jgi:hypothetical protein